MPNYRVIWEIDIDAAETPVEAAKRAWACMREPESIANVFTVIDTETDEQVDVDLLEEE